MLDVATGAISIVGQSQSTIDFATVSTAGQTSTLDVSSGASVVLSGTADAIDANYGNIFASSKFTFGVRTRSKKRQALFTHETDVGVISSTHRPTML